MSERIRLSDDGTMDTVLVCRECGAEARYNYDASSRDEQDNSDRLEEMRKTNPVASDAQLQGAVDAQCYDEWVEWAIEDFDSEHECETSQGDE